MSLACSCASLHQLYMSAASGGIALVSMLKTEAAVVNNRQCVSKIVRHGYTRPAPFRAHEHSIKLAPQSAFARLAIP